jgi:hypothetical protein
MKPCKKTKWFKQAQAMFTDDSWYSINCYVDPVCGRPSELKHG